MKYFFSYHLVYGAPFPLMWAVDDGIVVGGRPTNLVGPLVEISKADFQKGELLPLEKRHPYPEPEGDIEVPPSLDWFGG